MKLVRILSLFTGLIFIIWAFNCTASVGIAARGDVATGTVTDGTSAPIGMSTSGIDLYADLYFDSRPLTVQPLMVGVSIFANSFQFNMDTYAILGTGISGRWYIFPYEDIAAINTYVGARIGGFGIIGSSSNTYDLKDAVGFDLRLSAGISLAIIEFLGTYEAGLEAFIDYQQFGFQSQSPVNVAMGIGLTFSVPYWDYVMYNSNRGYYRSLGRSDNSRKTRIYKKKHGHYYDEDGDSDGHVDGDGDDDDDDDEKDNYNNGNNNSGSNDDGDGGEKIAICHKDKNTLYLPKSAIDAHLNHGDYLGECRDDSGHGNNGNDDKGNNGNHNNNGKGNDSKGNDNKGNDNKDNDKDKDDKGNNGNNGVEIRRR